MAVSEKDAKADGILRSMLARGKATHRQIGWLIGYIQGLRGDEGLQVKT